MGATKRLFELTSVRLPIVQAPMAGISSPAMAAAVGNAGALGSIGVGASNVEAARAMIAEVRAHSPAPFNVNLFTHKPPSLDPMRERAWIERLRPLFSEFGAAAPAALREIYRSFVEDDAMLAMLLEVRPRVVSFHFGLPGEHVVRALRGAGIVLFATATNLSEAKMVEAAGVDVIVAQGWEAGGHRGVFDPDAPDDQLGTIALTRLIVGTTRLPVVAAGGIMDGAGIAAVLNLGAAAVQLGTAFVATDESLADKGYRAALAGEAAHHTVMTRAISGRPARSLANRFTELGTEIPAAEVPPYPIAYYAGKALHMAGKANGDFGFGPQWAGQGAPLVRSMPAAELVRQLAAELREAQK